MTAGISTIEPTDDELDAAILAALDETPGGVTAWTQLRDRADIPPVSRWRSTKALVRLHLSGRVHAYKCGGRTFVDRPIASAAR